MDQDFIKEHMDALLTLRNQNIVEFHHQLRIHIQQSYQYDFSYFIEFLKKFFQEITRNGIFYIDVINDSLEMFLKKNIAHLERIVMILKSLESICDRRTLNLVESILRKYPNLEEKAYNVLIQLAQRIQKKILEIESKMDSYQLFSLKDILFDWY